MTHLHPTPVDDEEQLGWLERRQRALVDRMAERAFGEAVQARGSGHLPAPVTVAAFVLAGVVHGASAAVVAAGVWILTLGNWLFDVVGVVLVLVGLLGALHPRRRAAVTSLGRSELPTLYGVLDRVGELSRVRPPDLVVVDQRFNMAVTRRAWRRVLVVGAPFWLALPGPARVAVLAHELGHSPTETSCRPGGSVRRSTRCAGGVTCSPGRTTPATTSARSGSGCWRCRSGSSARRSSS